nr:hypothetical protein NitaMp102 [Tanacetum cinerariifolium]
MVVRWPVFCSQRCWFDCTSQGQDESIALPPREEMAPMDSIEGIKQTEREERRNPHGLYGLGHTRATMAITMGSKAIEESIVVWPDKSRRSIEERAVQGRGDIASKQKGSPFRTDYNKLTTLIERKARPNGGGKPVGIAAENKHAVLGDWNPLSHVGLDLVETGEPAETVDSEKKEAGASKLEKWELIEKRTYMQDVSILSSPYVPILWQPLTSRCASSKEQPATTASNPMSLREYQLLILFSFLLPLPMAQRLMVRQKLEVKAKRMKIEKR